MAQAQCLKYKGPDTKYLGRDICYGYNEDTLTIYDVTDPANSEIISVTSYEGATYTHQVCPFTRSRCPASRYLYLSACPNANHGLIGLGSRPRMAGVPHSR